MQQQQIKLLRAAAFEFLLRGHSEVVGVILGAAQLGVSEARKATRARAFAIVKIVPHRAHEAIAIARFSRQPARKHLVRRALAVHIRRHKRARALFVSPIDECEEALLIELLAKMHISAPTPSTKRCTC